MATNNIKAPVQQKQSRKNIFRAIENGLAFNRVFKDGIPVQYLPQILFTAFIIIFYIGNTHYADRTIRQIDKLKTEVDDLRADYTTMKAELMFASKQSEVAKRVKSLGIEESSKPPYKIIIKEESEY